MISKSDIPRLYENIYTDKVDDFLLVYNPVSKNGISVLNKEAAFLFRLIDGKRTVDNIFCIAQKKDPDVHFLDIHKALNEFLFSDIIFFNNKKGFILQKPKHLGVWLHITNQCNLRCTYCYVSKTSDHMSDEVAEKVIDKIIKDAKTHGFERITIKFSGGESLLKFSQILHLVYFSRRLARRSKIEIEHVVLTNGILITKKIAQILKREKLRLAVSLDGLGKYHNRTRIFGNGTPSFKYVEQGINNLVKYDVPFSVSITITSKNIENIPNLTKYLLKKDIPFAFNFLRSLSPTKERLEASNAKLIHFLKKSYKMLYQNPPRYNFINGLLDRVFFTKPHLCACGTGMSYLTVNYNGHLASCQMTLEKSIGTIYDRDLIKTMRNGCKTKDITVNKKDPCKFCQWKYLCCGGCPLLTYEQKGRYATNSPYCKVYKTLIPKVLRIEAKRLIKYGAEM